MLATTHLNIGKKIKDLLNKKGMTNSSLDRKAKLRSGTIANILNKRLTNPKIETLVQISEALDCSLYDLVNLKQNPTFLRSYDRNNKPHQWNMLLYISAISKAQKYFTKYNIDITLAHSLEIIFEIYIYSISHNQSQIDDNFAEWIVEKYSRTYK